MTSQKTTKKQKMHFMKRKNKTKNATFRKTKKVENTKEKKNPRK